VHAMESGRTRFEAATIALPWSFASKYGMAASRPV
jgi:hypothetical protein